MSDPTTTSTRKIFTVSELTREIKRLLEERYPLIWLSGEISNLRIPSSGHAYFSLKDHKAQISAVMFRGQRSQLKFDLQDGTSILAMGRVSLYEPRGSYQIILEYIEPKGAGALQLAFEQLKLKLSKEGLFDQDRKKALPFLPRRLGVITSPGGAVIQDVLNVVNRRYAGLPVDLYPVRVQGDAAVEEIVTAIETANHRNIDDIIILARGGGSIEDLAAFNTEAVARAIAGSNIPIVSAVGHETDFTIADFAADLRAPTPSAAAELSVPVKNELKARCLELEQRALKAVMQVLSEKRRHTAMLTRTLIHPGKRVEEARMHLDHLLDLLWRNVKDMLHDRQAAYAAAQSSLGNRQPGTLVRRYRNALQILLFKMHQSVHRVYGAGRERFKTADALLNALNPNAVLKRGYSITRILPERKLATDAASIKHGQLLEIQLANGTLEALAQKMNNDRQEDQ